MANKYFELAFELSGKLDNSFKSSITNTSKDIQDLQKKLYELEKGRSHSNKLESKFTSLRKSILETNREFNSAQEEVNKLAKEIKNAENPSKGLSNQFEKAKEKASSLKHNLESQKEELRSLKSEMDKAGTSTTSFAKDQKTLEDAINKTTKVQEEALKKQKNFQEQEEKINQAKQKTNDARMGLIDAYGMAKIVQKPIQIAMNAEETMADINKVANFDNEEELMAMQQKIMEMNTKGKIPMSFNELGQIVASGAQAGFDKMELPRFASDSAKMGIAMDMEAEDAGQTMAGWRSAFKINQDEVNILADKVNYLGNTTAASAPKIADFVTRVGALGEVGGVQSGEIAGIGATLIGMNIPTEIAATATNKLVSTLNKGSSATEKQAGVFKKLGFSATEMAKYMQTDAQGAILDVLTALDKLPEYQKAAALNDLFGETGTKAVAPLLNNIDQLQENLAKVDEEANAFGGSMENEFQTRIGTSANSIQTFKNNMENLGIILGTTLLPSLVTISEVAGLVATGIQTFATKFPNLTKFIVLAGTAFLVLNIAMKLGSYGAAIASQNYLTMGKAISWVKNKNIANTVATKLSTAAQWGQSLAAKAAAAGQFLLNNAMYAMPILLIIAGIALLILNFDKVKAKVTELWGAFAEKFPGIANFAVEAGNAIKKFFGGALEWVSKKFEALGNTWSNIKDKFNFGDKGSSKGSKVGAYATGGIVSRPELAWVGEGGVSEAIIPLEKTQNSISLWQRAGKALGMNSSTGIELASGGNLKSTSSINNNSSGDITFQFNIDATGSNSDSISASIKQALINEILPIILKILEDKGIDNRRIAIE